MNVIDFLERTGQDAQLRHASPVDMEFALAGTQIEPELRAAILARDQMRLEALLEREPLFCMQFPGKEDEEEEDDEGDAEESPSREGEKMDLQPTFYSVAAAV